MRSCQVKYPSRAGITVLSLQRPYSKYKITLKHLQLKLLQLSSQMDSLLQILYIPVIDHVLYIPVIDHVLYIPVIDHVVERTGCTRNQLLQATLIHGPFQPAFATRCLPPQSMAFV